MGHTWRGIEAQKSRNNSIALLLMKALKNELSTYQSQLGFGNFKLFYVFLPLLFVLRQMLFFIL